MSRIKRYSQALATGYILLGVNAVFTLSSVPLALHYLSREDFGLWALVMQVSGYLALIDLGMTGSISRILIDHKDHIGEGVYGSIIKTGSLVLLIQGTLVAMGGGLASWLLPTLLGVPEVHRRDFQILLGGQCVVMGTFFVGRMLGHVLFAHQRYDATNWSQMGGLLVNLGVLWLGFSLGFGIYSLLAAYIASEVFKVLFNSAAVFRLGFLPSPGGWGKADLKTFRELFSFGQELFLCSLGSQFVSASQVILLSHALGLEAAAIWSIATKAFSLGQSVVFRLLDFSVGALSEMIARDEGKRLLARFRDITVLSASLSAWLGLAIALCNRAFLVIWTKGQIHWELSSDWLMALLIISYSTTRCFLGFIALARQVRRMKYIYLCEGLCFIGLSVLVAPRWRFSGVIASALVVDLLCSGIYGVRRAREYFAVESTSSLLAWFRSPFACMVALAVAFGATQWFARSLSPHVQLGLEAIVAVVVGGGVFWSVGLSPTLRSELLGLLMRARARLRPVVT